jgi:hypothetical protein
VELAWATNDAATTGRVFRHLIARKISPARHKMAPMLASVPKLITANHWQERSKGGPEDHDGATATEALLANVAGFG